MRQQLDQLAQGSFVERGVNVLAFGLPGAGKTHARCALGHRLVEAGHSVLFAPAYRLVQSLPLRRQGSCWPPNAIWTCPASCASWTTSTSCSSTTWAGCRKTRTPARWYCWADCKRLNRIVSAGLTCGRCNAECSSGAASWPKSWSTPRPVSP